jgi:hypothetical protein
VNAGVLYQRAARVLNDAPAGAARAVVVSPDLFVSLGSPATVFELRVVLDPSLPHGAGVLRLRGLS